METGVSPATVSRVLRRAKLSRMKDIEPVEPVIRYEYAEPSGLIHLDIKRFGRFERVGHRITGDRTGQSNARAGSAGNMSMSALMMLPASPSPTYSRMKKPSAPQPFSRLPSPINASLGITVTRVMTDNGACYIAKEFAKACKALNLKHIRTRPYTPKTNGKAVRFIQTALREWAYARPYPSSEIRKAHLPNWTHMYNWHRPHSGLKSKTPISRLGLNRDNLLTLHS